MNPAIEEKALKCIRCGFCLDACPTFRLTGNEADSPRGRIYLMRSVMENKIQADDNVRAHLDACLGCRACETACPSAVPYAEILEHFRADMEESGSRPSGQSFARRTMLGTLTNPLRMFLMLKLASVGERIGIRGIPGPFARLLTGSNSPITLPATPEQISLGRLPERSPAIGERRYTVGILAGCVMRVLFNETNLATIRVLQRNGCEVIAPRAAGCCGALHVHSGYMDDAKARAKALLDSVRGVNMDAFVVNSAGCGSTLKEYGNLLADDPTYREQARTFSAKVRDISEWLVEIGVQPPTKELRATVAYHDACHLRNGQGITMQPRNLLQAIPGIRLIDLPESEICCGSAGIYNLTQPETARQLLERKIDLIEKTGAEIIATGNPGCLAWIKQGLAERGVEIEVKHPVEILDSAYE